MKFFRSWLIAFGLLLAITATAHACPGCKEALASADGTQGDIVSGYFWSILFMMSMPFTILGTFGIVVYRAIKKAQAAENRATTTGQQPSSVTADSAQAGSAHMATTIRHQADRREAVEV